MAATLWPSAATAELACEPLVSCGSLLVASLVAEDGRLVVELGRRPVTSDGVRHPAFKPLRLPAPRLPRLRRLAEAALGALAAVAAADTDAGMRVLARDGEFGATLSRGPGESAWFSLVLADGSGVVAMPAREATSLAKLVRDAERELSNRGLAALDRGAAH